VKQVGQLDLILLKRKVPLAWQSIEKVERDLLDWKNILGVLPKRPWQLYTFLEPTGVQVVFASCSTTTQDGTVHTIYIYTRAMTICTFTVHMCIHLGPKRNPTFCTSNTHTFRKVEWGSFWKDKCWECMLHIRRLGTDIENTEKKDRQIWVINSIPG
jgi:hypothetical protein